MSTQYLEGGRSYPDDFVGSGAIVRKFSREPLDISRHRKDLSAFSLRHLSIGSDWLVNDISPRDFLLRFPEVAREAPSTVDHLALPVVREGLIQQDSTAPISWSELVSRALVKAREQFGDFPGAEFGIMTASETAEVMTLMRQRSSGIEVEALIKNGTSVLTSTKPSGRPDDPRFVTISPRARLINLGVHDSADLTGDIAVWPVLRPAA